MKRPDFSSPRLQRRLLIVGGLVLAAGVAATIVAFSHNTTNSLAEPVTKSPPKASPAQKSVPLSNAARYVAGRFILTAVQRKHLDEAWQLAGPNVRGGLTYRQWLTGNIPVVPFLDAIDAAPMKIDESTKTHAMLEIALLAKNKKVKPAYFIADLYLIGKGKERHWVVDGWVPAYGRPDIQANPNN